MRLVSCGLCSPPACGRIPFVPFAPLTVNRPSKVVALGAKHQTLLQRLGQLEADITAAVSLHESREAVSAEEAQKVGFRPHFLVNWYPSRPPDPVACNRKYLSKSCWQRHTSTQSKRGSCERQTANGLDLTTAAVCVHPRACVCFSPVARIRSHAHSERRNGSRRRRRE